MRSSRLVHHNPEAPVRFLRFANHQGISSPRQLKHQRPTSGQLSILSPTTLTSYKSSSPAKSRDVTLFRSGACPIRAENVLQKCASYNPPLLSGLQNPASINQSSIMRVRFHVSRRKL